MDVHRVFFFLSWFVVLDLSMTHEIKVTLRPSGGDQARLIYSLVAVSEELKLRVSLETDH
jgi:hypothetical protein